MQMNGGVSINRLKLDYSTFSAGLDTENTESIIASSLYYFGPIVAPVASGYSGHEMLRAVGKDTSQASSPKTARFQAKARAASRESSDS